MKRFLLLFLLGIFPLYGTIRGGSSLLIKAKPGDEIPSKVSISNDADYPVTFWLKQSDYTCNMNGESFYSDAGTTPRSNSRWISLHTSQVTIPAKSDGDVYYSIRIPTDKGLHGSYWSSILIEPVVTFSPIPSQKEEPHLKSRDSYQVITTIGTGNAKPKLVQSRVVAIGNMKRLDIDIGNEGDLVINAAPQLKVYDYSGGFHGTFRAQAQYLFPNCSARYSIDIEQLEPNRYIALLLLDGGEGSLFFGDRFNFAIP